MMIKYPVFFVESPFQLISAMEAVHFYSLADYRIFVRLSGKDKNDFQMKYLIDEVYQNIAKVLFIKIEIGYKSLKSTPDILCLLCYLSFQCKGPVFLGNYNSHIIRLISSFVPNANKILLDDGTLTLVIQKQLHNKHLPLTWFTMFELSSFAQQTIITNHFLYLKGPLSVDISIRKNSFVFIGSNMDSIISYENLFGILNNICLYLGVKGGYYIPHRSEPPEMLSLIEYYTPLEIKKMNCPIELIGRELGYYPDLFASFFSTALFSLKIICEKSTFISFRFNYAESIYKGDIDEVYSTMNEYFTIVDI